MPTEADTLLSVDDLAARYGVSKSTVYQWNWARHRGRRPSAGPPLIRIGRHVRYRLSDVLAWEAARTQHPTEATP